MQKNPQELSWQAIEAIVGVKLPSNVLRFDDIGFHLIKRSVPAVIDLDSDIEIVEDDWDLEKSDTPKVESSNNENGSPDGYRPPSTISNFLDTENNSPENYSCDPCDTKFDTKAKLSEHITKDHSDENDNSVDNGLSIESFLEVNISTDDSNHPCITCNQIFNNEDLLAQHRCVTKLLEERRYPCHTCAEKFSTYWELRKHINTHFPGMLDSKSSFCHLCQKDYTKTGFMNHLRKHTGERPFVCELCNKAFSQSSSLSIHMKFHLNVRKHACSLCEKKFVTKSELSRHMTVHTKQKSYYCGVCDKAFTRSDNMKKHEKTHG